MLVACVVSVVCGIIKSSIVMFAFVVPFIRVCGVKPSPLPLHNMQIEWRSLLANISGTSICIFTVCICA